MKNNYLKRGGAFALAEIIILLALIALFAAIAVPTVQAQDVKFSSSPQLTSVMWDAGSSNLATVVAIDVRKTRYVGLTLNLRGVTTATNTLTFGWSDSNSTSYSTNANDRVQWIVDTPSAVGQNRTTNIDCGAHAYLVLYNVYCTQKSTNSLTSTSKGL